MKDKCPICGSETKKTPLKAKEMLLGFRHIFNYSLCCQCGCAYLEDTIQNFSLYYSKDYHVFNSHKQPLWKRYALEKISKFNFYKKGLIGWFIGSVFKKIYGHFPETNIGWIGEAYRKLGGKNKKLKIVDLGSGGGSLLSQLKKLGFTDLLGVELHGNFKDPDIPILKMSIEDFLLQENTQKFDIVVLSHVLEHLFDHEKILHGLKKILNKNGILIISMPILGKAFEKFGMNWYSFDAPRHVLLHSDRSFQLLIDSVGLHIYEKIYEEIPYDLFVSEMYARDISSAEMQQFNMKIIDKYKYKKMAEYIESLKVGGSSVVYFICNK